MLSTWGVQEQVNKKNSRILGFIIFNSNLETWQFYKIKREKEEKRRRRGIEKEAERKRVRAREGERRRRERKGFVQAYHGEGAEEYMVEKYWLFWARLPSENEEINILESLHKHPSVWSKHAYTFLAGAQN